jgi:uncharacterized membrane protein
MKSIHLTDETLQAYLLNELQDETIATHLAACPNCLKRLEEYQHLIAGFSKIAPETFSFEVTSLVMDKINEVETQKEKNKNIVLYLSLSSVLLVALIFLYPYFNVIFTQLKLFSIVENLFMLVSVLGVVIFLLYDLFRQYKQKEMFLLQ